MNYCNSGCGALGPARQKWPNFVGSHIQESTPLHVLQELGGWSSPEMVRKYAHLSREHLAQWVDRRSGTFFTTENNQEERRSA
jgi:hypothetical protein